MEWSDGYALATENTVLNESAYWGLVCGWDRDFGGFMWISGGKLLVMEYLYQAQFALKRYDFFRVQDIHGYPGCID